ncbi:MAG: GNAT family N-acetyltransferase [Oscillospiraceae bacterium]|nr:GNAT family N-acetyltransferase [Oscillospiraceae bacterium]
MTFRWLRAPEDLSPVFTVREDVFIREQGFHDEFDERDNSCWHLLCEENGRPAGCARIFPEEQGVWHIGRVAVEKPFRGAGVGAAIMEACHRKILELGGSAAVLSAQCRASGFYEKLGYRVTSSEYLDEHCPHVDMRRTLP